MIKTAAAMAQPNTHQAEKAFAGRVAPSVVASTAPLILALSFEVA
jgi:hypothetical protein